MNCDPRVERFVNAEHGALNFSALWIEEGGFNVDGQNANSITATQQDSCSPLPSGRLVAVEFCFDCISLVTLLQIAAGGQQIPEADLPRIRRTLHQ